MAQRAARPIATPWLFSLLAAREALASAREGHGPGPGPALATAERLLAEGADAEDLDWLAADRSQHDGRPLEAGRGWIVGEDAQAPRVPAAS